MSSQNLHITLDIYSGNPNPEMVLSEGQAKEFFEFSGLKDVIVPESLESILGLGYRGFICRTTSDEVKADASLPQKFRILGPSKKDHGITESLKAAAEPKDMIEKENWLLESFGNSISSELKGYVRSAISSQQTKPKSPPESEPSDDAQAVTCNVANTRYNPGYWNQPDHVLLNNCYNYAMNTRTDTFAQPGKISGHLFRENTCQDCGSGADFDGCKTTCRQDLTYKNVALVIWPPSPGIRGDFHWYRLQAEGFWGHKPGKTSVRNIDNSGNTINRDNPPRICDRGPYTIFCGYRYSPVGMRVL
jgi:hypothetical protein